MRKKQKKKNLNIKRGHVYHAIFFILYMFINIYQYCDGSPTNEIQSKLLKAHKKEWKRKTKPYSITIAQS